MAAQYDDDDYYCYYYVFINYVQMWRCSGFGRCEGEGGVKGRRAKGGWAAEQELGPS